MNRTNRRKQCVVKGVLFKGILFAFLMTVLTGVEANAQYYQMAIKSTLNIKMDEITYQPEIITGYVIEGRSFYKIREIAECFGEDDYSQFNVVWNREKKQVEVKTHSLYKGERKLNDWEANQAQFVYADLKKIPILVDGVQKWMNGFLHNNHYYVDLWELKEAIGFEIKWNAQEKAIVLLSEMPVGAYSIENTRDNHFTDTIEYNDIVATPIEEYIYYQNESYYVINRQYKWGSRGKAVVKIRKYGKDWKEQQSIEIPYAGEVWAGFYHGKKNNYFVFGNSNPKESDRQNILTLVKTDHNFQVKSTLNISNAYTFTPFKGGSLSMTEWKDYLIIHTARLRYFTKEDGLRHQSQLTVAVDTEKMQVLNDLSAFQANHVGHSFNQFVLFEEQGNLFLVDHGDAKPKRAIQVTQMDHAAREVKKIMHLFDFPGAEGINQTGAFIGGVAQSENNILLAINQIDYSKAHQFSHFNILDRAGNPVEQRNVYIYIMDKLGKKPYQGFPLTNYAMEKDVTYSAPKIVAIAEDKFMVLWEKSQKNKEKSTVTKIVQSQLINDSGQKIGQIKNYPWYHLGKCNPIYQDGKIIWQASNAYQTVIYTIPVE